MTSIGERLREERLRRGLTVAEIAEQTKINSGMLEAIETENFDRLPGGFFVRSFVRQYARALGIPESEFDAELDLLTVAEPSSPPPQPSFRPIIDRRPVTGVTGRYTAGSRQPLGSLIVFLLIVAACTGIYALWQNTREPDTVASVQPAAPVPAEPAPIPPRNPPATDEPTPAPPPIPAPTVPVRVDIRAMEEPVWIRVTKGPDTEFEGTLAPGESRSFTADEAITMRIGRPGSVEVVWNGKTTGPLQPAASPITLEFTAETYRIVRAAPPAEEI
jgi:cytoskeleton protein RodZ